MVASGCFFPMSHNCLSCQATIRVRSSEGAGPISDVVIHGVAGSEALRCTPERDETVCVGYPTGTRTLMIEAPGHEPAELTIHVRGPGEDCRCPTVDETIVLASR